LSLAEIQIRELYRAFACLVVLQARSEVFHCLCAGIYVDVLFERRRLETEVLIVVFVTKNQNSATAVLWTFPLFLIVHFSIFYDESPA
jgi:hypothetical protein